METTAIRVAELALQQADPILGTIIARQKLVLRAVREDYFSSLCRSIVGQQVSVAAAAAIYGRLEEITKLDPATVATLSEEQSKIIGLSRQKLSYITDLARHFVENPNVYNHLEQQTDEAVIAELIEVKGIGVWTAQMFLMFTLDRPDVFAVDDIGLQNAIIKLFNLEKPTNKQLLAIADKWRPYRSVASLHLWQSLSNTP